MNTIIKQVLAFILSFALIFSSTSALAASPVGWSASPADIIINGATATITAIKGAGSSALQSTVNHAPTVGNIGKKILKGAGGVAVAYAVTELIGAGVDWVLDPANNRIKYGGEGTCQGVGWYSYGHEKTVGFYSTPAGACQALNNFFTPNKSWYVVGAQCEFGGGGKLLSYTGSACNSSNPTYHTISAPQYIPISTVAQKVQSNAAAGHAPSQELIKTVVIDDINAGVLDAPLNVAAVPVVDAPPVNPPYDPTQPAPPFDPSSIIAAIKSVMAAVVNMSGVFSAKIDALMIDLGLKQAETIEAITAGTGEIVAANDRTGAKVAEMVAAIEAIEGNTMDGQVINDAIDRVIANDNVKVGDIVAAIEAIEGNTLDGQLINDAVDRVIANDNVNAQAGTEAAEAAEAARTAADAANTAAVTDAIEAAEAARAADAQEAKEAADAKAAADADFQEWVKEEAPVLDNDTELDIPIPDLPTPDTDINFGGSCPANFEFNGSIFGNPINIVLLDTSKFCGFLSTFVKFPVYAASSLFALYILGGRKDV